MGVKSSRPKNETDPVFLGKGSFAERDRADAVAFATGITEHSVWVDLSLQCSRLVNKDLLSLSDPFCVLFYQSNEEWKELGRTEVITNDLNPKFVRSFQVLYMFERVQRFRVDVFDADEDKEVELLDLDQQDFLGTAEFKMTDLVRGVQGQVELPLLERDGDPMDKSTSHQTDEVKVEIGASISCAGLVKSGRAFYRLSKQYNDNWLPVYRSEVANPNEEDQYCWKSVQARLRRICNHSGQPLLLEVMAFRSRGPHQLIGKAVLSLEKIEALVGGSMELTKDDGEETVVGRLMIKGYHRSASPSFLEYVASGFEICFLVAIDYTASNGHPDYPTSLHHVLTDTVSDDRRLNVYEEAIFGVGRVLEAYDSDQLFPTWGFGAKLPGKDNVVSHCFAINGNDAEPECHGVQGILKMYREALSRVKLAGPTFFSPVLKAAATMAARDNHRKYYCLLMITDGILLDMPKAKREIIAASGLPLSIMLVGVGKEDFSKMIELDADDALLTEDGVHAQRDIVQFVEFEKHKNDGERLAQELLAEFPGQFLSYMRNNGIMPNEVEEDAVRDQGDDFEEEGGEGGTLESEPEAADAS